MKALVGERGQVTIPKRLRERLGIRPGTYLEFEEGSNGRLIGKKAAAEQDPVDAVYGILGASGSTDDLIRELRGGDPDL